MAARRSARWTRPPSTRSATAPTPSASSSPLCSEARVGSALSPPTLRHPGLGFPSKYYFDGFPAPGSTGPQGSGRSLQPPPSPQSGPRTKSGVTKWSRQGHPTP
ncbi:hypothetical protein WR25_22266 [Diploscapter pachys]|uniref:Uncharacterized protein n=1 Tax=Diploscapter pachys TaxID=2018661 RepID=A0A2A2M608_9BILA|nr:hypothetical protein WR25_22266 [Diploscapter pachys]